jgi:hypothetical protein
MVSGGLSSLSLKGAAASSTSAPSIPAPLTKKERKVHHAEKTNAQFEYCSVEVFHHITFSFAEIDLVKEFQKLK